jgi:nitroreductase
MDAEDAIQKRRSVRSYLPDPIPNEILRKVLEAGRLAPSAANRQPWSFIIVKKPSVRKAISRTGLFAGFLGESPVVIVGCGDKKSSPNWYAVDVSIALENMVIAATAEGLGTCWIGSFDEAKVKDLLKIPKEYKVVALLAMGYPKEPSLRSSAVRLAVRKKKLGEVAMLEEYGKPFE